MHGLEKVTHCKWALCDHLNYIIASFAVNGFRLYYNPGFLYVECYVTYEEINRWWVGSPLINKRVQM